mmetsp:Transcript_15327/g.26553  ORF Transcript_15327/g.26553 Transcript_15327/m.26553 type:complete len:402 (+) Transcript_15327:24-1229(+)
MRRLATVLAGSWTPATPSVACSQLGMARQRMMLSTAAAGVAKAGPGVGAAAEAPFKPEPLSFVLFIPSIVCGYLAWWQWERSKWKRDLIRVREEMLDSAPQDIYSVQDLKDYMVVSCSGRLMHERSVFVGPRPRSIPGYGIQSGYFLITPLYDPTRKGAVMLNRGWVPSSWEDNMEKLTTAHDAQPRDAIIAAAPDGNKAADKAATDDGGKSWFGWWGKRAAPAADQKGSTAQPVAQVIHTVGVVQPSEQPSAVLPDNVPDRFEFHWVDVPTLAVSMGLPADTPLVQAITDDPTTQQQQRNKNPMQAARDNTMPLPGGPPLYPLAKNTSDLVHFTTMPRDHLTYTFIWVSLFVVLSVMARQAVFFKPKMYRMVGGQSNKEIWKAVQRKPADANPPGPPPKA